MKNYILAIALIITTLTFGQKSTFSDDFSDNHINWAIRTFDSMKTSVADGHYIMNNLSSRANNVTTAERWINPNKDFSIETSVMQESGSFNNGYGIIWGKYRSDNFNKFIISGDGYYYITQTIHRKATDITDWVEIKDSTIFNPVGEWNKLKVEQVNGRTKFYINDHKIFETGKINCSGVQHGMTASNKMRVKFDYIKMTNIDEPINEISSKTEYKVENLGPNINSKNEENSVKISADGKTMFFTKNGDENIFSEKFTEIYRSDLQEDGTWSKAVNVNSPINNKDANFTINVSPDKNELYINDSYTLTNGKLMGGVAKSTFQNGKWNQPERVNITKFHNDTHLSSFGMAPDGKHLLMSIADSTTFGGIDLYISFHQDDNTWSQPINMGSTLNTFAGDFTPFVAGDNKTLFFSSYGHKGYGSADIFMSKRLDDTWLNWSTPINIGPSVNSWSWDAYYCISAKGDYGYLTANKKEGYGSQDLYRIKLTDELKPEPVTIISGQVIDAETKKAIDANIIYEDLATGKEIGVAVSSKENGFQISLPSGKNYGFLAKSKNYISVSQNIDLTDLNEFSMKTMNLAVAPIKKGQVVRINNLFFDLAKYSLRNESKSELNRLVELLKKNSDVNIEVIGHTDSQGNKGSNQKLSENRAKSVLNYLVENGVSSSRITSKGKGSTDPVESNDTEQGRQVNRRVEFRIK
jgi:outer membrane protein OmpA-like peptidoglycan-associated protein